MQATKIPSIQGKYQDSTGTRYSVNVAAVIRLPAGSSLVVSTVENLAAFLSAEGLTLVPAPVAEQARSAARAAFAALPAGKQALWESVRAAVDKALAAGQLTLAGHIIQTVPEIYDGMEADRAVFLALFPNP